MYSVLARRFFAIVIAAFALIGGCGKQPAAQAPSEPRPVKIVVLAAASLADAFREVGAAFEIVNPRVKVEFSFAGSNQLRTQLESGSPGDVFASADRKQMDRARESGVVAPASVRVFANNRLAIVVPKANRASIKSLADLARPGLKIVIADKTVPGGNYTVQMLDKAGQSTSFGEAFVAAFEANVVSREQNVAAVVTKVALDEADAGIAYASDAAGGSADRIVVFELGADLAPRAEYLAAVAAHATDPKAAERFVEFLASQNAAAILAKRGFTSPDAESK